MEERPEVVDLFQMIYTYWIYDLVKRKLNGFLFLLLGRHREEDTVTR